MSLATEFELLGRILIAGLCGALIGFERKNRKKEAGIRTHIIVALASSLMMIISKYGFFDLISGNLFPGMDVRLDPSRIASCIVSGIGFLGAGMIFTYKKTITGLTTAAGIWATAGVGMAIGGGLYIIGISSAVFIVIAQIILHKNLKFLRSESHENLVFTVKNYAASMDYIERNFEKLGISIDSFDLRKLGEGRAEIEFSVSFISLNPKDVLQIALSNDEIERVNVG